jgi:hypothetical protein
MTGVLFLVAVAMTAGGATSATAFIVAATPSLAAPSAVMAAAGLATLGWLVSASNQRTLSRKQHTLNLLIQMRHAELYNKHVIALTKLSPGTAKPSPYLTDVLNEITLPANDDEGAFKRAVIYVMNYWEFVCAAVVVGDLDADLVRRTVRQNIVGYHDKFSAIIDHERALGQKLVYRHLRDVANEWRGVA